MTRAEVGFAGSYGWLRARVTDNQQEGYTSGSQGKRGSCFLGLVNGLSGQEVVKDLPFFFSRIKTFFFEFYFIYFLCSWFLLVIYFIHISVYMSIPISQFITPPPPPHCRFPPLVSIRLFSTSVSLFLPCKPVHLYHFSRFPIYVLMYSICFSLSDFTLYDSL